MRTHVFRTALVLLCAFFWLLSTPSAEAQCTINGLGFSEGGELTNNPFHAEIVTTSSPRPDGTISPVDLHPELVARDSQGRVRTERIAGEFLRKTGPDAGTKAELHLIVICDPVARTFTQIDTATSSATIRHFLTAGAPHLGLPSTAPKTYCSRNFTMRRPDYFAAQDLGFQNIEGLEVQGQRISVLPPKPGDPEVPPIHAMTTEQWCSEQLAVMVSTERLDPASGRKTTRTMRNIERVEPDPELFKIPQGYTVAEAVPETSGRTPGSSTVVPAPNHSQ